MTAFGPIMPVALVAVREFAKVTSCASLTSVRRCCTSLTTEDSLRESMPLDARYEQAISHPLLHDDLVQLQRIAAEEGIAADPGRQGHDLARAT